MASIYFANPLKKWMARLGGTEYQKHQPCFRLFSVVFVIENLTRTRDLNPKPNQKLPKTHLVFWVIFACFRYLVPLVRLS